MSDQFRDLFGRFENLNLINLKLSLEKDEALMGGVFFQIYDCSNGYSNVPYGSWCGL